MSREELLRWTNEKKDLPLFHDPHLYEALFTRKSWKLYCYEDDHGLKSFGLDFVKKKMGITYCTMPPLIKYSGPWIAPSVLDDDRKKIILNALPNRYPYAVQNWAPELMSSDSILPRGIRRKMHYTYRLDLFKGEDFLWSNLGSNYRKSKIPNAQDQGLVLSLTDDIDIFWAINSKTFKRIGMDVPYSKDYVRTLDAYLKQCGRGQIFLATNGDKLYSAAYMAWDHQTAYLLMAGDDPHLRKTGSGIWLTWEIIKYATHRLRLKQFDFLGSMIPGVERVRKQFGATQTFYAQLQYSYPAIKPMTKLYTKLYS